MSMIVFISVTKCKHIILLESDKKQLTPLHETAFSFTGSSFIIPSSKFFEFIFNFLI